MFKEGDFVPDLTSELGPDGCTTNQVEPNHCGLPWLCGMSGEYCGVIQISGILTDGRSIMCDAISGKILTEKEINNRLNNYDFDYENKSRDCQNWRKKNQPYGPYGYKYSKFTKFKIDVKNWFKNIIQGGSKNEW